MNDQEYLDICNKLGKEALDRGDYPCGCVIVKDDEIIAKASSTGITENDLTKHAEMNALREAFGKIGTSLGECILYSNIEPCSMCADAIRKAGIRRVVFSTPHNENEEPDVKIIRIENEKSDALLREFSLKCQELLEIER